MPLTLTLNTSPRRIARVTGRTRVSPRRRLRAAILLPAGLLKVELPPGIQLLDRIRPPRKVPRLLARRRVRPRRSRVPRPGRRALVRQRHAVHRGASLLARLAVATPRRLHCIAIARFPAASAPRAQVGVDVSHPGAQVPRPHALDLEPGQELGDEEADRRQARAQDRRVALDHGPDGGARAVPGGVAASDGAVECLGADDRDGTGAVEERERLLVKVP